MSPQLYHHMIKYQISLKNILVLNLIHISQKSIIEASKCRYQDRTFAFKLEGGSYDKNECVLNPPQILNYYIYNTITDKL